MMVRFFRKTLFLFCGLVLFVIPLFFWGDLYFVGGDDSKLYYLFPWEYLIHFTSKIISDNQLGTLGYYFSQSYISTFTLLLVVLNKVFFSLNTQMIFFGLILSSSFFAFHSLLGLFYKDHSGVRIVSSLVYALSNFSIYTIWQSQLFSIVLLAVFPWVLRLFLKGIMEKSYVYILISSIIFSLFGIVLFAVPWLAALVLASFPVLVCVFFRERNFFFKSSFLFLSLVFLLNFFWIFHFLYSPFSSDDGYGGNDMISSTVSEEFKLSNQQNIYEVSKGNDLVYPFLNLFHKDIQADYGWETYAIFSSWNLKFYGLNIIFPAVIFSGLLFLFRKNTKNIDRKVYIAALTSWLLILFLFTVKVGGWGVDMFTWMSNTIPGFVMFRNMFDKFGMAMAFSYAFVFASSLKILVDNTRNNYIKNGLFFFLVFVILLNAQPFIRGEFYKNPIWTTKNTYNVIKDFNRDFYDLVSYLKEMDTASRFLWVPLNKANYVQIRDQENDNHYYSGVSPLQFLSSKQDFNGKLSFPNGTGDKLLQLLQDVKYDKAARLLRNFNVGYVIVNNDISKDLQKSYLYGETLFDKQSGRFREVLLGDKIADFGARYSLYEINDQYKNEKIYLTKNLKVFPNDFSNVVYKKNASYEYEISVRGLSREKELVFLDPYHKQWELYWKKDRSALITGSHDLVFEYANGWKLDADYIIDNFDESYYTRNSDGTIDIELLLYFRPQKYFYPGVIISATAFLISLSYLLWYGIRRYLLAKEKSSV